MSNDHPRHRIIFADRQSLTPDENDVVLKQKWIEIYNENLNEGAVRADGTIAWDCPCLGTQAIGPCSKEFRTAFSCYHSSVTTPKGTALTDDSLDSFHAGSACTMEFMHMQQCFARYPKLYRHDHSSNETSSNEYVLASNYKSMGHPEARRQRLKEEEKQKEKN